MQAAHAAIEAVRTLPTHSVHPHLVLCGVENEHRLEAELARLEAVGLRCFPFYEPDIGDSLTAFAVGPLSGEARRQLRRYNLIRS